MTKLLMDHRMNELQILEIQNSKDSELVCLENESYLRLRSYPKTQIHLEGLPHQIHSFLFCFISQCTQISSHGTKILCSSIFTRF